MGYFVLISKAKKVVMVVSEKADRNPKILTVYLKIVLKKVAI